MKKIQDEYALGPRQKKGIRPSLYCLTLQLPHSTSDVGPMCESPFADLHLFEAVQTLLKECLQRPANAKSS